MQLIDTGMPCIEPKTMWQVLFRDLAAGAPVGVIAARFHKGLATGLVSMVERLTGQEPATNVKDIALSGGVFQNKILLEQVVMRLERRGFHALIQSKVPSNDGGLSLGQATIAAARQIKAGGY